MNPVIVAQSRAWVERLARVQEAVGLTDGQLAEQLGVSRPYVVRLRTGSIEHPSLAVYLAARQRYPVLAGLD